MRSLAGYAVVAIFLTASLGFDDPPAHPSPSDAGRVAPASPEPNSAKAEMRLPAGVKVDLYAAEPLVANPVAFHIDDQGKLYLIETFRHTDAVTDNREHMYWLDADLAARTVEDRVAMYKKFLPNSFGQFAATEDRLRLIVDKNGDGKADTATVFADGFSKHEDGIAAGVLARKGNVYLASIPSLWLLRDTKGTGKADVRKSLHDGYGVHVAFLGHDLHGLRFGPDGRLYFSIGDRGLHVKTPEGKILSCPDSGAVLRCEADGSNLEIFATGLRNPQELAFDDFGNLFTVDNNSDSGDKARVVQLVDGSDSGWRIGYQYIEFPVTRGPWNGEKLWYPRWDGQASYIVPPLANLSDGPSGLTREPGVSLLPAKYKGRFFLADFRGAHGTSGIRSFSLKPAGASFTVEDSEQFIWSVLATDVDFGPDGALYVSDWVDGWRKTGKGRVWKYTASERLNDPKVAEVKAILAAGMSGRSVDELAKLMGHEDQRVRQEAQFELAERALAAVKVKGENPALAALRAVASGNASLLSRVHAVWGIGQTARAAAIELDVPLALLKDGQPEIRAQAARILGDALGYKDASHDGLIALLSDPEPRVRVRAAEALGRLGDKQATRPILEMLVENEDRDAIVRHSGVVALARIGDVAMLARMTGSRSKAARLASLLALRRLASTEAARYLGDPIPSIVTEAALAIYEAPIDDALPKLAALEIKPEFKKNEPLLRRVIAANERVGGSSAASALAAIGLDPMVPDLIRVEAFEALGNWTGTTNRDRINGLYRPLKARAAADAKSAVASIVPALLELRPATVRSAAINALAGVGATESSESIRKLFADTKEIGAVRLAALKALDKLNDPGLARAVTAGVDDKDGRIRSESHRLLARLEPEHAIETLSRVWDKGSVREKQNVADILGNMKRPEADAILASALDALAAGKLPPALELDVREAAARRADANEIKERLAKLAPVANDPVASYLACLQGGDASKGEALFKQNTAVECLRCHKIDTKGGEVGPELTKVGGKHDRRYLLEAIVTPNKAIAEGFESVVVAKADGTIVTGVFRAEDAGHLRLMTTDGKLVSIPKSEIEERKRGPSAMPDDIAGKLTKSQIRDIVEYLSGRK